MKARKRGLTPGRVTFMVHSEGDGEYRCTEQVGMMPRGFGGLAKGREQTIPFPPVANLKADRGPVKLKATSDSGLPIAYDVAYGPARIEDGALRIAEIPARAKYPIEVKVVAYQFGRAIAPLVKPAAPVAQTIRTENP